MKGVRPELEVVFHNDLDGAVGPKIVDVIFRRESQVSSFGIQQNRVIVIAAERRIVHEPHECCPIAAKGDVDCFSSRGIGVRGNGTQRHGL